MMKIKDGIIGHAIGDAMGVPIEFYEREKLLAHPVTDMIDGYVPKGYWSDDTSMEIALIESFNQKGLFDYDDIMMKFSEWINKGKYTPSGKAFDMGRTCLNAIRKYDEGMTKPVDCGLNDFYSNGNGSLMRILPVAYYCFYKKLEIQEIYQIVKDISSLTHANEISILGCYIYVNYAIFLLNGDDRYMAYHKVKYINYSMFKQKYLQLYSRILEEDISELKIEDIKSSGYVVDTLEAVLWVFLNASSYREAIIASINLGGDTDTIGAITGSLAGILYGYGSIPQEWLHQLVKRDYLEDLSLEFEKQLTK